MKNINRYIFLGLSFSLLSSSAAADEYSDVLRRIISGSRQLKTERAVADAESAENMTGLNLANPEVEFAYQWATPGSSPDKKILDVSQSFDFATLSGGKRRVARSRNALVETGYQASLQSFAGDVDRLMTETVYLRQMEDLYEVTDTLLQQLDAACRERLRLGDMSPIDYNVIQIQCRNVITDMALNKIEIETNMAELDRLGGGHTLEWNSAAYCDWSLPADFNAWIAEASENTPGIDIARAETELARQEVSLRRKEGLPSFSLGYTSEMIQQDNHFGMSLGIELPLWGNHGRVKAARAAAVAAEARLDDLKYMQRAEIEGKYKRAAALRNACKQVMQIRNDCGNTASLDEAYRKGAITVDDYLGQLIGLLEIDKRVIETERDYQLALVELRTVAAVWRE
ncbi:MAG: TolC family protein [Muribaculaceae bacterium]|nr:TolC family protein [Muribaculaceae bacterium]